MGERRTILLVAASAALGAIGLLVAGCGGSGSAAPPAAPTTATTTAATTTSTTGRGAARGNPAAVRAFASCLKAHGVASGALPFGRRAGGPPPTGTNRQAPPTSTPPRFGGRPGGGFAGSPKLQKAFQACRSKLPGGFRGGRFPGRPGRAPTSTTGNPAFARYTACLAQHGVEFGASSGGSATFRKAQAACRKLLPAQPPAANG